MTSYHEYNKVDKAKYLVGEIQLGKNIAIITDAGTPGISDPGEELVRQCIDAGIEVSSVPGPAACITALTMSGQATRRFAFEAFLPSDKKERALVLEELRDETRTIIIYEAPHHLLKTLEELYEVLGDRSITLCKELTKLHEQAEKTTMSALIEKYSVTEPKGEHVLVIAGKTFKELKEESIQSYMEMSIEDHMEMYLSKGMDKKEAMKAVAKDRGVSKRDIYDALLEK
jgi:16S rRNA (cytidine1402-2'-O)-methyltransferase